MFRKQLRLLADETDHATDVAYARGKKAYGTGKSLLRLTQRRAEVAAKEARESAIAGHILEKLPVWQSQLNTLWAHAADNWGRTFTTIGSKICTTESAFLHLTLGYLALKWYQNRDKDVKQLASGIRAHVSEKPITSVVIVLSVGYLIGKLRK